MSGCSYDYLFARVSELADKVRERARTADAEQRPLRMAFADLLDRVSEAAYALEWCDSCDTSWDYAEPKLRGVVAQQDELRAATAEAKEALLAMQSVLERTTKEKP